MLSSIGRTSTDARGQYVPIGTDGNDAISPRLSGGESPTRVRAQLRDHDAYDGDEGGEDDNDDYGGEVADSGVRGDASVTTRVYWAFWALGAGVLLSWNVLICSIPLLTTFFPPSSPHRASLASYLSATYCFSNLFFLGLSQRSVGKTSPTPRLRSALLALLLLSLLLTFPILPLILPSLAASSSPLLLPLLLLLTLALAASTAYLQSAVFALAALWAPRATLAVMSGQGGIAVLVSGTQCVLAVVGALGSPVAPGDDPTKVEGEVGSGQSPGAGLAGVGLWALGTAGAAVCLFALRYLVQTEAYARVVGGRVAGGAGGTGVDEVDKSKLRRVFRKNGRIEAAVAWVFVVTLSVFPSVTTAITSTHTSPLRLLQPDVFIPLHFLIFNVGDYIGRTYTPAIPRLFTSSPPRLLALSLARTLFVPLFLLCNVAPTPSSPPSSHGGGSPIINSDLIYLTILVIFGITNGHLSSLCMITASVPALNPAITDEDKDVAGTLAAFCLVAGLAGGSGASFLVGWGMRAVAG